MNDYISRAEAVALAMQYCPDDDGVCSKAEHDLRELVDDLENAPPADVRPVVYGHWERRVHLSPIVEAFCSICGDPALRAYGHPARTNYCPNCEADMREATA